MPDDAALALARLAGQAMYERDGASQSLGMELLEIRPGYALMSMPVHRSQPSWTTSSASLNEPGMR